MQLIQGSAIYDQQKENIHDSLCLKYIYIYIYIFFFLIAIVLTNPIAIIPGPRNYKFRILPLKPRR